MIGRNLDSIIEEGDVIQITDLRSRYDNTLFLIISERNHGYELRELNGEYTKSFAHPQELPNNKKIGSASTNLENIRQAEVEGLEFVSFDAERFEFKYAIGVNFGDEKKGDINFKILANGNVSLDLSACDVKIKVKDRYASVSDAYNHIKSEFSKLAEIGCHEVAYHTPSQTTQKK